MKVARLNFSVIVLGSAWWRSLPVYDLRSCDLLVFPAVACSW